MFPALHIMLVGLVRRTWFVAVLTVIACAMFAARGVASVAAARIDTDTTPPHVAPVQMPEPVAPPAPLDAQVLVERNIFCSSCTPAVPGEPGPAASSSGYRGELAKLVALSLGKDSYATVTVPATSVFGSWGVGERIPGVGTVTRIGNTSIDVADAAGATATLTLLDPVAAVEPGAATPDQTPAVADPFADRISKRADGSFDVDRSLVRELVSGATKPGGVRLLPVMKDGEVAGVKVLGAKAGTIAASVGLKSNDQITAIDGEPLKNAQQLINLMAGLDQTTQVTITGTRGKGPLSLTLHLR
jgi:hypothetical protein